MTFHHTNTRNSRAARLRITHLCVSKTINIHVSCLLPYRNWHLPQTQVPSHPSHLPFRSIRQSHQHTQDLWSLDPYLPYDVTRQSYGSTQIPSLTDYESKSVEIKVIENEAIESEDLESRRIELDRNLGTDPYQIQERFVRNSFTEYVDAFGKVAAESSYLQSEMHSDITQ